MLALIVAPLIALPVADKPFFDHAFLLGAHRGGVREVPENTAVAFRETAKRYPNILLETDVRMTKDGHLVLLHDETVDRTTNGTGKIGDLTLAQVRKLDAGYRFTLDGTTFPWRGKGVRIATLEEALDAAPRHRFELDLKTVEVAERTAATLKRKSAVNRVLLASFVPAAMSAARKALPEAATCYDFTNGARLLAALRGPNWDDYKPEADALSMMKEQVPQFRLTPEEIAKVRAKGIRFQIHTLDEPVEIRQWLAIGVDSILTDRPEILAEEAMAKPMARAHSHNDYEHKRPLLDAMEEGFASVEADIYLQEGELRVAHDLKDTQPGRTLERLYLDPLLAAFRASGRDSVYPWRCDFQLLVDVKQDGDRVYAELERRLAKYRPMLTRLEEGRVVKSAVTVVLSGARPVKLLAENRNRYCFLDGRWDDPDETHRSDITPILSDSYFSAFKWLGGGKMPEGERARLRELIERAHARGAAFRLWAVPDTRAAWEEMYDAGMDYLNTDNLPQLAAYLRRKAGS
jgi:glycerophosphoryl diester phosphodiesterase